MHSQNHIKKAMILVGMVYVYDLIMLVVL